MSVNRYALLAATALASLCPAPALAADPEPRTPAMQVDQQASDTAAQDDSEIQNEDIIVTAQKREQLLIDVPQSISVVSGATLEKQQATNFQDYLKLVPGLQLDQSTPGAGRLILRGLNTGGVASSVATYADETPFGSSTALANGAILAGDFDTFDVARVEVLRGPQGTLYGASTLGGIIKFVTNAPDTTKLEARGRAAVETTKGGELSYRGNLVLNVPLGETLAVRATGFYNKNGGWIDSIGTTATDEFEFPLTSDRDRNINDSQSYGGRASALFKPSDAFDIRLTAFLQNIRADAPSIVESDPDTLETRYGRQSFSQFVPNFTDIDYRVYNGTLNYDFGFATLTSSTSYSTQKQRLRTDATFNLSGILRALLDAPANDFLLAQRTNTKRFTQEVRLTSAENDTFEWLLGGFYNDEKGLLRQSFQAVTPGTLTPITFPFALGEVDLQSKYKEYAGFANATLHLSDRLHLDFGGRYSHNKQSASQEADGVLAGNVPVNTDLRSSDNVFTFSVAPRFEVNDQASVYARVAKGYRPGGPNVIAPNAPADTPESFDPDTVVSYELGFKGETADRRFGIDIAGYHIDWKDIQLLTVINNFGININGGSAEIDGVEFTATFRPTIGLVTSINGTYTKARLTSDTPTQPTATGLLPPGRDGDRLPFTPPYSVSVNSDYGWDVGGDARASFGGSLRFLSKQSAELDPVFRDINGRQRQVPSYIVLDLRAGVEFGRFGIEAFARNLANVDGKTSVAAVTANGLPVSPNGSIGTGVIRPRSYGLSLTAGF